MLFMLKITKNCKSDFNRLSNKKKEAPDLSFALIRAFKYCISFLRIELYPFQVFLLRVSSHYINALTVKQCCSLHTSNITISFTMFGW